MPWVTTRLATGQSKRLWDNCRSAKAVTPFRAGDGLPTEWLIWASWPTLAPVSHQAPNRQAPLRMRGNDVAECYTIN